MVEKILPSQLPLTQEAQHSFDEWSKITLMSPVSHNTCCVSKLGRGSIRDVTIERDEAAHENAQTPTTFLSR
jgi:hypothetical protein